ncbi:hypothetical protein J2Y48_000553 [Mycoplana sp. BE70]|uniref:COG3904 family protein n=1 Tax=Mycoplana sp. BE70 TaxID=2817775 RepID=UPI002864D1F0|nr:hypothetical protein [Mycoplana sp. BE70]MDR6755280.1 hypothetical protein [Mycoplana sp. BE70]
MPFAASVLSLGTATILGGYGFGNGSSEAFGYSFGFYLIPQIVVCAAFWLRLPSFAASTETRPRSASENHADKAEYQAPTVQVDANEHPECREGAGALAPKGVPEAPRPNLFARYWRGEFPLATSYWGVNFLVNLAVVSLISALTEVFSLEGGFEPNSLFWFLVLLWLGLLVLLMWQVVGLWRSARRHAQRQRQANKTTFWAGAARVAAVLGVLQTAGTFIKSGAPQIGELYKIAFEGDPDIPPSELKLLAGGTELSIFGGIKYGLSNDVERLLKVAPAVTTIHLTSSGGRIAEAGKLLKLIRSRALDTYVPNECSSACTLVFAAGSRRSLLEGAKLGFHGPSFPGLGDAELRHLTEEWAHLYREAGLRSEFVNKALAVSPKTVWYPSASELLEANAVTAVVTGDGFALSGHEVVPSLAAIEREMRAANRLIDALHTTYPDAARQIYTTTRQGILAAKPEAKLREDVNDLLTKAIVANLARADDDTLAQYAALMSDQYTALNAKDPALCFQYAALGASVQVTSAFPQELITVETILNERVLRSARDRPPMQPEESEAAWASIFQSMTSDEVEVFSLEPSSVAPERHAKYCQVTIAIFKSISHLETRQAAMLMREIFLDR